MFGPPAGDFQSAGLQHVFFFYSSRMEKVGAQGQRKIPDHRLDVEEVAPGLHVHLLEG